MCYTRLYNDGIFEWDERKEERNRKKHDVSFRTAALAFGDPNYLLEEDRVDEETGEQRWHWFGLVEGCVLYLIVPVYRKEGNEDDSQEIIHIISARQANPREGERYFQQAFNG